MKKYFLAAAAVAAIATPAAARDGSGYIGVEGGALFPKSQNVDASIDYTNPAVPDVTGSRVGQIDLKTGYDLDLIGGYDFGMFRLEGELGYKHSKADNLIVRPDLLTAINTAAGTTLTNEDFDLGGNASVLSGMLNGLVDFGGNGGVGFYAGGGFGRAHVKEFGGSDSAWAWQLIAGASMPVSDNIDVGLKYRYFHTGNLNFDDSVAFSPVGTTCGTVACTGGTAFFNANGHFSSHSLLASLVYNFGAPAAAPAPVAPPPPPPPAAPATQTCPDGSVILATDACPAPPPPPPPPAPVERGERGQ
jgi:opacity protein-like surface antigen